jgi:hypothetical protein
MTQYYCLVAGLPDLQLEDGKSRYTVADFREDIYPQLDRKDRRLVDLCFLVYDNANLLALLRDKDAKVDAPGLYTAEELTEMIRTVRDGDARQKEVPAYLYDFIEEFQTLAPEQAVQAEDLLAARYYAYGMACGNPMVSEWMEFNLNVNNILAALAARKYKMEVGPAIVGRNEVSQQLRSSNARDFGLPEVVDYYESVARIHELGDWLEREHKIDRLKWDWLDDKVFFHYFSVERIFAFVVRLALIERWMALDKEKGTALFRQLIAKLKEEAPMPEEFRK